MGDYTFKAAKQNDMKVHLSGRWNAVIADPYHALDCREDDNANLGSHKRCQRESQKVLGTVSSNCGVFGS